MIELPMQSLSRSVQDKHFSTIVEASERPWPFALLFPAVPLYTIVTVLYPPTPPTYTRISILLSSQHGKTGVGLRA
jgi:hypothetical protein